MNTLKNLRKQIAFSIGLGWFAEMLGLLHLHALPPHTESERPIMPPKPAFKVGGKGAFPAVGIGRIDVSVSVSGVSG